MKLLRQFFLTAISIGTIAAIFLVIDQPEEEQKTGKQFLRAEDIEARRRQEFMMLRDPKTNAIPKNIFLLEQEFAKTLPKVQSTILYKGSRIANSQALPWIERGPNNTSGRIRGMGIDIRTTGTPTIIAGAISGGIWKSTNGGDTWSKKTTSAQLHSATCIAQDTRSGQNDVWYAGSGENVGNSASGEGAAYLGNGVFKSTDNGETWNQLPSTNTADNTIWSNDWQYVWRIGIHPTSGNVYAATTGGIYRSTDGGTSWTQTIAAGTTAAVKTDVAIAANGTIYVASSSAGDGNTIKGIRKSTDDGMSWSDVTPAAMAAEYGRTIITTAPSDPAVVYFFSESVSGANSTPNAHSHMIWRSTNSGTDWSNISSVIPSNTAPALDNFSTQNGYDMILNVKPDDPKFIIVGGVCLFKIPDVTNDNLTLAQKHIGGYGISENGTANALNDFINHHPDNHFGVFKPGSTAIFYCANDGGVHIANDITATAGASFWQAPKRTGLNITQLYGLSLDKSASGSGYIAAGLQDRGNWMSRTNGENVSWTEESGGDGAFSEISPNGTFVFQSTTNGNIFRYLKADTASPVTANATSMKPDNLANPLFINPFVIDPAQSDLLYFAGGNTAGPKNTGIWRTTNATEATPTWTYFANSDVAGEQVSAMSVSSANSTNVLYYGTSGGKVFRIDGVNAADAATVNPTNVTGPNFPAGYVNCIAVDPANSANALAVFSNYNVDRLWYTTNSGGSWTSVTGNLTGANSPSIRFAEMFSVGNVLHVFLGTSTGVYFTVNLNGSSTVWTQEATTAIGNVVSVMLDYRASDGTLVVATHGRGAFQTQITAPLLVKIDRAIPSVFTLSQNYPNPFNPSTMIKFSLPASGNVSLTVFDIQGKEITKLMNGFKEAGTYEIRFDGSRLASGVYLYKLEARGYSETKKMILTK